MFETFVVARTERFIERATTCVLTWNEGHCAVKAIKNSLNDGALRVLCPNKKTRGARVASCIGKSAFFATSARPMWQMIAERWFMGGHMFCITAVLASTMTQKETETNVSVNKCALSKDRKALMISC